MTAGGRGGLYSELLGKLECSGDPSASPTGLRGNHGRKPLWEGARSGGASSAQGPCPQSGHRAHIIPGLTAEGKQGSSSTGRARAAPAGPLSMGLRVGPHCHPSRCVRGHQEHSDPLPGGRKDAAGAGETRRLLPSMGPRPPPAPLPQDPKARWSGANTAKTQRPRAGPQKWPPEQPMLSPAKGPSGGGRLGTQSPACRPGAKIEQSCYVTAGRSPTLPISLMPSTQRAAARSPAKHRPWTVVSRRGCKAGGSVVPHLEPLTLHHTPLPGPWERPLPSWVLVPSEHLLRRWGIRPEAIWRPW